MMSMTYFQYSFWSLANFNENILITLGVPVTDRHFIQYIRKKKQQQQSESESDSPSDDSVQIAKTFFIFSLNSPKASDSFLLTFHN